MSGEYWIAFTILSVGMFIYLVIDNWAWYKEDPLYTTWMIGRALLTLAVISVIFAVVVLVFMMVLQTLGDRI